MAEENNIIIYQTQDGKTKIDVKIDNDTVWLNQAQIAELLQTTKQNVSLHIQNIFDEKELDEMATVKEYLTVQNEGNREVQRKIKHYNLDVIISVGYRVKSLRGTQFRIWATQILKEYMIKGFAMDDDRLKNLGGGGYWHELLERIRDIRASEKVFYRQVLDIYATSIDYDPHADTSVDFFKKVQNKIHYAVSHQTAAEIIYSRADAQKEFMGLTTFKGKEPHLSDVIIAKNYLDEKELRTMGQIVSGYLDFAERQAERHQPMTMKDWAEHLDKILTATGEDLLQGAGSISHQKAVTKAKDEYQKYQAKTLSAAEKDYLESLKTIEKQIEKK